MVTESALIVPQDNFGDRMSVLIPSGSKCESKVNMMKLQITNSVSEIKRTLLIQVSSASSRFRQIGSNKTAKGTL